MRKTAVVALAGCALLCASLLVCSGAAVAGMRAGLTLCGDVVIPALFPFLLLPSLLTRSGAAEALARPLGRPARFLFRLPGAGLAALLLALTGGYPIGGRAVRSFMERGDLTKEQAGRALLFCVCGGPAFQIVAVGGGMLRSVRAGFALWGVCAASTLMLGILSRVRAPALSAGGGGPHTEQPGIHTPESTAFAGKRHTEYTDDPASGVLTGAVSDALAGILQICAWVLLFSCALSILRTLPLPGPVDLALSCVLEVTSGSARASATGWMPLIAAVLAFGGLSTHCQIYTLAGDAAPRYRRFLLWRLLHAGLSASLAALFVRVTPAILPADVPFVPRLSAAPRASAAPFSAALLTLCALLLAATRRRPEPPPSRVASALRQWRARKGAAKGR